MLKKVRMVKHSVNDIVEWYFQIPQPILCRTYICRTVQKFSMYKEFVTIAKKIVKLK